MFFWAPLLKFSSHIIQLPSHQRSLARRLRRASPLSVWITVVTFCDGVNVVACFKGCHLNLWQPSRSCTLSGSQFLPPYQRASLFSSALTSVIIKLLYLVLQIRGMPAVSNCLSMTEPPFQLPFFFSSRRHLTAESAFIYFTLMCMLLYLCFKITVFICEGLLEALMCHISSLNWCLSMFELCPGRYFCNCAWFCSFKVKMSSKAWHSGQLQYNV